MYRPSRRQNKKRKYVRRKIKRQIGGFLNRSDLAYAGRDIVNQAAKVAPGIIKGAANKIGKIAQQRVNQIILQGEKKLERVLPKILRGAIEDVYQTPFRMLGNFGRQILNKVKKKILN